MEYLAGIDIGGTKCAVTIGKIQDDQVELLWKEKFPTPKGPQAAVDKLVETLKHMLSAHPEVKLTAVGISCGGPLDSRKGLILCPPNLPDSPALQPDSDYIWQPCRYGRERLF